MVDIPQSLSSPRVFPSFQTITSYDLIDLSGAWSLQVLTNMHFAFQCIEQAQYSQLATSQGVFGCSYSQGPSAASDGAGIVAWGAAIKGACEYPVDRRSITVSHMGNNAAPHLPVCGPSPRSRLDAVDGEVTGMPGQGCYRWLDFA